MLSPSSDAGGVASAAPRPERYSAVSGAIPSLFELGALAVLLGYYWLARGLLSMPLLNFIGPLALGIILATSTWRMLQANATNIWTPLFWFRVSTTVYFSVGNCFVYFAGDASLDSITAYYAFDDTEFWNVNFLVTVSVLIILGAARLTLNATGNFFSSDRPAPVETSTAASTARLRWAIFFLVCGAVVELTVGMPHRFGWVAVIPSSIGVFEFSRSGLALLVYHGLVSRSRKVLLVAAGLAGMLTLYHALSFSKQSILLVLLACGIPLVWVKPKASRVLSILLVMVVVYFVSVPFVTFGRNVAGYERSIAARFDSVSTYVAQDSEKSRRSAFIRLCYVHPAAFAMSLYDSGSEAHWPPLLAATLVPRVIWPDKPIITDIGTQFNVLATGNPNSASSPGIFADSYWAMGWMGVFVFLTPLGILFGIVTAFVRARLRERDWAFLPLASFGLFMGARVDGAYLPDVAGATVLLLGLYVALRIFRSVGRAFTEKQGSKRSENTEEPAHPAAG